LLACAALAGCDEEPTPAQASGKDWKEALAELAGSLTLSAEGGVLFHAFDTLAYPGESVDLTARLLLVKKLDEAAGATLEFSLGGRKLGTATTGEEGYGRLAWKVPKAGDHEVTVKVVAARDEELLKASPASLLVSARPKETRFAVIDLDHTVVASSFFRVLVGGAKPMPGAAEVVAELRKTYSLVYLTHRPDLMTVKSKGWLTEHGFPRAPLLVSRLSQALGSSGKFKTGRLKALREQFPRVAVGIGDKISDVEAYAANGLKAYLIPHYDRNDDDDVRDMAKKIGKMHKDIQVVDGWDEVRDGLLKGKNFPARSYAKRLTARAKQLEEQRRRKKEKDDDDDDDDD